VVVVTGLGILILAGAAAIAIALVDDGADPRVAVGHRDRDAGARVEANDVGSSPSTPTGVTPTGPSVEFCHADHLEYAGGGQTGLLRFFNRGGPCKLAGSPTLIGRKLDGSWVTVHARMEAQAPVSGSPPWTGVFDPSKVAVLAIRPGIETSPSQCAGHELPDPVAQFSGLRVRLPKDAGVIEITDTGTFDLGPCEPHLTSFSYDTTSG
jgi:hypothetical protein